MTYTTGTDHPMVPLFEQWLKKPIAAHAFEHMQTGGGMGSLWSAFVGCYELLQEQGMVNEQEAPTQNQQQTE